VTTASVETSIIKRTASNRIFRNELTDVQLRFPHHNVHTRVNINSRRSFLEYQFYILFNVVLTVQFGNTQQLKQQYTLCLKHIH
jgi:hypothetical protein